MGFESQEGAGGGEVPKGILKILTNINPKQNELQPGTPLYNFSNYQA